MTLAPAAFFARCQSVMVSVFWLSAFVALNVGTVACAAEPPLFKLPIDCKLGSTCFVQNYVDHDSTSDYRDFACGAQTYDKHDGTDFRLPSLTVQRQGVAVVAAASGTVAGVRDGVPDVSVRSNGKDAVQGRECGNGAVIRHDDGWETQYCHLAQGSLRVAKGQHVQAGQVLGAVGLSGMTEFPHLHFTVRHQGKVVDPFAPEYAAGQCGGGATLWDATLEKDAVYRRRVVLNSGFADRVLSMEELEALPADGVAPDTQSAALVAFIRVIGLEPGDVQSLVLYGSDGVRIAQTTLKPLERARAQSLVMVGHKKPVAGWSPGSYRAVFQVAQKDKVVFEQVFTLQLE